MTLKPLAFPLSLVALALLAACDDGPSLTITPPPGVTPDTYVLTSGNKLVGFAASAPAAVKTVSLAIPAGETLLGGDFRPADTKLYVVTRTATNELKAYTADLATGALGTAIPLLNNGLGAGGGTAGTAVTLAGAKVSVDFNPVANALRIVDSTGVNLRTTLAAGNNSFIDAPLSAGLAEAAYTNTFATTCQTDLYYINASQLLLSAVPNGVPGNLATPRLVGGLGVTADADSGFDVRTSPAGNTLTAALKVGGSYGLYTISPATGLATSLGALGVPAGETVLSLAANLPAAGPVPQPGNTFAILGGAAPSLVNFNRAPAGSPAKLCGSAAITGIGAGENIVGADTRPADGLLYALTKDASNAGRLYTVAASGAATLVATLGADPNDLSAPYTALDGSNFTVDFNPVPDRLRVISNTGQNLRMTVAAVAAAAPALAIPAGGVTTDTALTTASSTRTGITAGAYTNSIFGGGATSLFTSLFGIDSETNALVLIGANPANGTAGDPGNPNSGIVTNVANLTTDGSTALDVGNDNAFDIVGNTGVALLAATVGANTTLYTVNLGTGVVAATGNFTAPVLALGSNGAQTAKVFGLTTTGKLVSFGPSAPGVVTAIGTIGVPAGETIQGIDFRPSIGPKNGLLVAMTTAAGGATKLYSVDPVTATPTLISTLAADATDTSAPYTAVAGTSFGIDFNPLPDRLRTVSNTAENLRSNVDSGGSFTDTALSTTGIYGAGYSNSFTSAGSTTLYYLRDAGAGNSTLQMAMGNPNDGVLVTVGTDLGADFSTEGDLDLAGGQNGFVLAALQPAAGGASGLFRVNLGSGAATSIGTITTAGDEAIRGIAIQLK
ncbi:MAG: DUF4394 domain-containing protein [Stagnimonas sp.]|nr:DUF4394 domain-containing protein [Stagnimonas sp.]